MSDVAGKLNKKTRRAAEQSGREARLQLIRINIWSAAKISFVVSLALGLASTLALLLLVLLGQVTGLFSALDSFVNAIGGSSSSFSIDTILSLGRLLLLGLLGTVIFTVFGTVFGALVSLLYNISARLVGGVVLVFANSNQ